MTLTKRNLTLDEAIWLYDTLDREQYADVKSDLNRRIFYGMRSWIPYGGLPKGHDLIYLDPRWRGDRKLIELAQHYNIGKEEV